MRYIEAFVRFVWDFVVGDDWRIAVGVVLALAVTAILAGSIAAWWVMPVAVAALLAFSVWRAAGGSGYGADLDHRCAGTRRNAALHADAVPLRRVRDDAEPPARGAGGGVAATPRGARGRATGRGAVSRAGARRAARPR